MSTHFDPAREAEEIGLPPGHTLRPATWDDVAAVAALRELANRRIDPTLGMTEEEVRREWGDPGFDPAADARLVFDNEGALVAYYEYYAAGRKNHPALFGRTHPDAEGRGLGTAGLRWTTRRAMEAAESLPPGQRVSGLSGARRGFAPATALLEGFGMKPIRRFWKMVIELEGAEIAEPRWPAGIALRPFDPERHALALYRAFREAFEDHWGHDSSASEEEDFEGWRHWMIGDAHFDPTLFFVAWDGEEIAGFSLCRDHDHDDPTMGWLTQLGVRPPWRKRGLAMALLHHTFAEFERRGRARVGLHVDGDSPTGATRLYERAGMRIVREWVRYEIELRPGYETAAL